MQAKCVIEIVEPNPEPKQCSDDALFIGIRPSRTSGASDFGHLWVVMGSGSDRCCGGRDCERKVDSVPMGRPLRNWVGYYPEAPELPNDIIKEGGGSPVSQFCRYFLENAIPGARWIDRRAMSLAMRFPERITWVGVFGTAEVLELARSRIHIESGDKIAEGRYGLDTNIPGVNNCVSWAANEVVNPLLAKGEVFNVDNPPLLSSFMKHPENARCRKTLESVPQ